jgi:methyl acetate hydrolase
MRSITLCFLVFLLISSCENREVTNRSFPLQDRVTVLMDEAMTTSDLPAVVVTAINKKGQRLTYTHGKAVWTEDQNVTTKHIFRLYSMTKAVTSIAAMQLVEKGFIGLDDDLSSLMPEMSSIPILSNGHLSPAKNPITLRHLLTHTSGFGYIYTDKEIDNFDTTNWRYKDLPRRFESGTQFLYGTSIDWVGRMVEKVSNMDLESYFRKNITGPLGMNRTWFNVPDSLKGFIVSMGKRGDDGKQPLEELPDRIPTGIVTEYSGGAGLFSTPEDYTKLLYCLLNGGKSGKIRILKNKTIKEMTKNQIGDMILDVENAYFQPLCCDLRGLITKTSKWGLAWAIDNENKPYGRRAGTVFWGGSLNTYFYIDFKSGIAASIYTQHFPFNHPETTNLFERFSEIVYSGN